LPLCALNIIRRPNRYGVLCNYGLSLSVMRHLPEMTRYLRAFALFDLSAVIFNVTAGVNVCHTGE